MALGEGRKALIGPDLGPYNRASATGECGKGMFACEARERARRREVGPFARGQRGMHCRTIRPLISRVFWVQCLLTATVAAASMPFGRVAALSALIGGINSLVPTAYFAHKVLRRSRGAVGGRALGAWLRAEVAKIAIICGMFVAAFVLLQGLDMMALFAGFIVVHVGGVIASMTLDPRGGAQD